MNAIQPKPDLVFSIIESQDSYKLSHYLLIPKNMSRMFSYFESRGGEFSTAALFGLQIMIHRYLSKPFTIEQIDDMAAFASNHGEPFNRDGFVHMLNRYGGKLPVRIRAVPEGLSLPTSLPLITIESTDDDMCAWIVNYIETQICRSWYPSTILTSSREVKKVWQYYLELSADNPEAEIGFKHHDFGARGVSCQEQAELGGAAHLVSFLGSDTIVGIKSANHYYDCPMSGFSIPATEHSTMTIFGRLREREALTQWITKTLVERELPPGIPKLSACVIDSYDALRFVHIVCEPRIRSMVESSGGTLVLRPDSGDPLTLIPEILEILEHNLPFGAVTVNTKGFKVLPPYLRLIWGDGINRRSMKTILKTVTDLKWSASNLAFGSGGGLLQDVNRDTQRFAFKCSAAKVGDTWVDVVKDPATDHSKRSKAGRLDVIRVSNGNYSYIVLGDNEVSHSDSIMNTVFENGEITHHITFDEVRANSAIGFKP